MPNTKNVEYELTPKGEEFAKKLKQKNSDALVEQQEIKKDVKNLKNNNKKTVSNSLVDNSNDDFDMEPAKDSARMTYQQAERIRKKSFGSLLGEQEGGLGESLRKTLSIKGKARMTGIKEKFDPLNIAKFLTGGSNFAPAALGKLFGRSKEDIARFSGSKLKDVGGTATKIDALQSENQTLDMLMKIYEFMQKSYEDKIEQRNKENAFAEENKSEKDRRHKELIAAITGKPMGIEKTAEKIQEKRTSFVDDVLSAFGGLTLAKTAFTTLATVAKFFAFNPVGLAILGSVALGALFWKLFSDKSGYEDADSELSKGLKQAESVGGLSGVKDEAERRKKLPEYDRTMAEIQDFQQFQNEGDKLNDKQLEGFANRGPGALEAVEDYKQQRKTYEEISGVKTPQPSTTAPSAAATPSVPMAEPASGAAPISSVPMAEPAAVESIPTGQALSSAQSQNLDLNIPESQSDPSSVVNNTVTASNKTIQPTEPMPSVRNQEPTFADMILYSTRVV